MRHWAPGGHLAASASGCIGGGLLVAPQFRGRVWRLCGGSLTFPTSLQMGTNKCASQSGMTAYGTRRHLYDPKNHILPPMDHSTISLQMGTNKCASQVGRPSSPRPPCPDSASAFCVSPGKLLPSSALVSFKVGCPEAHPTLIFLDPAVITFPAVYQFDVSV